MAALFSLKINIVWINKMSSNIIITFIKRCYELSISIIECINYYFWDKKGLYMPLSLLGLTQCNQTVDKLWASTDAACHKDWQHCTMDTLMSLYLSAIAVCTITLQLTTITGK